MYNQLFQPIFKPLFGALYGSDGISPSFRADLLASIEPHYSRTGVTPTFTRATTATVTDHEGRIVEVPSGAARFAGARFVKNEIANASSASLAVSATDTITVAADTTWVFSMGPGSGTVTFSGTATGSSGTLSADSSRRTAKTLTITGAGTIIMTASVAEVVDYQIENVTGRVNQNPSEHVSKGVLSPPYHGLGADAIKAFTTHNGNTVSSGVVTEADGPAINSNTSQWVELDGAAGTYVSTPDSAAASVTGDITLIAWVAPDDWTPGANEEIIAKYVSSGNQGAYALVLVTTGIFRFVTSSDGSNGTQVTSDSTVATGFADGSGHWVRASWDDSGDVVNFYTSDDPIGTPKDSIAWTQLGDPDVAHASSGIYDSTAPVEIGSAITGTVNLFNGKIGPAYVIASTDPTATPAVTFNPNKWTAGVTWEDANDEVWTLQGNAVVRGPFSQWGDLPGSSGDYFSTPDQAMPTGDAFFLGYVALDDWTPASNSTVIGQWNSTGNQAAFVFQVNTSGGLRLMLSANGIASDISDSTVSIGQSNGIGIWVAARFDVSANEVIFYTSADSPLTPYGKISWTQLGASVANDRTAIFNSTQSIEVGAHQGGTLGVTAGKVMRAAVIASTDPTVAPSVDFDARAFTPGVSTAVTSTGETWTANGNTSIEGGNFPVAHWDEEGPLGYLSEGARTNLCLYSNDFSNAAWVATNVTKTDNAAIGPFGTKTAASLEATAANGTVIQDLGAIASAIKAGGFWLKRSNGTGNIDLTLDGGSTWTTVDVGNYWRRFEISQTLADPDFGIRLVTSGDIVFIEGGQVEAAAFLSTDIPTEGSAVARNAETGDNYSAAGIADSFPLTATVEYTPSQISATAYVLSIDDDSANNRCEIYTNTSGQPVLNIVSGGTTYATITSARALIPGETYKITAVCGANDAELYVNGVSVGTDTSVTVPVSPTVIRLGHDYNDGNQSFGEHRLVEVYQRRLNDTQVAGL